MHPTHETQLPRAHVTPWTQSNATQAHAAVPVPGSCGEQYKSSVNMALSWHAFVHVQRPAACYSHTLPGGWPYTQHHSLCATPTAPIARFSKYH